jgi:hypothetical protein
MSPRRRGLLGCDRRLTLALPPPPPPLEYPNRPGNAVVGGRPLRSVESVDGDLEGSIFLIWFHRYSRSASNSRASWVLLAYSCIVCSTASTRGVSVSQYFLKLAKNSIVRLPKKVVVLLWSKTQYNGVLLRSCSRLLLVSRRPYQTKWALARWVRIRTLALNASYYISTYKIYRGSFFKSGVIQRCKKKN